MLVRLSEIDLDATDVAHAVDVTRVVAKCRRASGAARKIRLITTDVDAVRAYDISPRLISENRLGCTYFLPDDEAVIWISSTTRPRCRVVRTLTHELAHALGDRRVLHGYPFRRLFVTLLPFVGAIFDETFDLTYETRRIVHQFRRRTRSYETYVARCEVEVARHISATRRVSNRLARALE